MSFERPAVVSDNGKSGAVVVYLLYLLSLPSIGLLMFVGVILAYMARGEAAPWVRTHYDHAIKIFWTTFWWTVLGGVVFVLGFVLVLALGLGLLVLWALGAAGIVLAVWYHFVALIGLLRLLQDKHA